MIDFYKIYYYLNKFRLGVCKRIWFLRCVFETEGSAGQITISNLIVQKVLGFNRFVPWPVHYSSRVSGLRWIKIGVNTAPGLSPGCYIFANKESPIEIGDYTLVAPNVGIAGFNHDPLDIYTSISSGGVKIGSYCWIGMNSIVLPGVVLGDHTVVAAGAVVTKSYPEGYCLIGGNPAKLIRHLPRNEVVEKKHTHEYIGYRRIK